MKKKIILVVASLLVLGIATIFIAASVNDGVMTKKNGVYIVNTTTLGTKVQGFNGPTPLKIYIKDNKIQKVEALPNDETPSFFDMVTDKLLSKWNGMSVDKVSKTHVDAVSGATYSSNAVKENVRLGVAYYLKNK